MKKGEENAKRIEEVKRLVIKEKGNIFWEEFIKGIEQSQRENFINGYKYAISILEDALIKER